MGLSHRVLLCGLQAREQRSWPSFWSPGHLQVLRGGSVSVQPLCTCTHTHVHTLQLGLWADMKVVLRRGEFPSNLPPNLPVSAPGVGAEARIWGSPWTPSVPPPALATCLLGDLLCARSSNSSGSPSGTLTRLLTHTPGAVVAVSSARLTLDLALVFFSQPGLPTVSQRPPGSELCGTGPGLLLWPQLLLAVLLALSGTTVTWGH